ncbi:MAG TPA: sodium:calcium antiporter [Armatimonadota bacterium]|jgi:cation:H+ antiporter
MSPKKSIALLSMAALLALPALIARFTHLSLSAPETALVSGLAILGASFLLLWACDAAQADISQAMALAVVALIAVLPEYAVDMYFTWMAGKHPESHYAQYAVANMTGANRLLIGVAWSLIVFIFYIKTKRPVRIGEDRRLELLFLAMATVYAFCIPLKGSLNWFDGIVFLGLYSWYIVLAARRPCEDSEAQGVAEVLLRLPQAKRRIATAALFTFSAVVIGLNAGPFSEGLVGAGKVFHMNEFLLVQWLAPIASEAPEFIVAITFAIRGQAGLALGSLLSAKLNQWTLLIGMIPGAYAISHGSLQHPIPMNSFQMHEILLTAAQSFLGIVLLATLRLSVWQAMLLLGLFLGQFAAPGVASWFPRLLPDGLTGDRIHQVFSLLYITSGITVLANSPHRIRMLWRGLRPALPLFRPISKDLRTAHCLDCPYRQAAIASRHRGPGAQSAVSGAAQCTCQTTLPPALPGAAHPRD